MRLECGCGLDKPAEVFNSFSAARLGVRHGDNLTFHRQDTKTQSFEKLSKMTAVALTHTWQKMFHVLPQPGLLPKEKENHPPSL
jgi:hypothetical protein